MRIKKIITFDLLIFKINPMLKTQIDIYDMFLSVENKFDNNPDTWRGNEPVTETVSLFNQELDNLAVQVALQLESHTGVTEDKDGVRALLEEQMFTIAAATNAYAVTNNKGNLARHTHYPKTTIAHFRDAELQSASTNLANECRAEKELLIPYGITEVVLNRFERTIADFALIMKNPKDAIATKKRATDEIALIIPKISELLKTRLDNLMHAFRDTHPEFVDVYFNLRTIKPTGSRPLSLVITTLDQRTKEPVAKAKLEIVGVDIKRVSSKRGYNKVAHLSEGRHEITVSQPNYTTKTVEFTVVSGETTELIVYLDPK